MVVVAHPDDADFGCSGTVSAWAERGCAVTYCVITSGQKGTHDPKMPAEKLARTREREQRAAARVLGVEECVFLGRVDGELEVTMELRGEVCRVIREQKPELLLTQDPWRDHQMHPDHRAAGWLGLDGLIAARDHLFFPEQLKRGLRHHRVKRVLLFGTAEPNLWFDVSATLPKKVRALQQHKSQLPQMRNPSNLAERMTEWARAQGRAWGLEAAEAFRYFELG